MRYTKAFTIIAVLHVLVSCVKQHNLSISSPDQDIVLDVKVNKEGVWYSIHYKDSLFIKPSALGFEFKSEAPLQENFKVVSVKEKQVDTTWTQVWGQQEVIVDNYNQLTVELQETNDLKRTLILAFKVYNDGLGFRYEIPEQSNIDSVYITKELTEFKFANNYNAWYNKANFESYEMPYQKALLSEIPSANTPITIASDQHIFASIHEANLTNYAGMTLIKSEKDAIGFECNLVPWPDGVKVKTKTPMVSPWRTIQITDSAEKLVTSHLILNLNPPNNIEDVSWIQPMKYIGIWWGMHLGTQTWTLGDRHGANTMETKRYIDFASAHHIQGVLVEGWNTGWEDWGKKGAFDFMTPYNDFDLTAIAEYANSKLVNFIGHIETGGDAQAFDDKLDSVFGMYHKLGIKTVKTGYAGAIQTNGQFHHGQYMVNHYRNVVEKAAAYQIMIDAHEPIKPTGIRRTYPNMMTREGVKGMEWNAWSSGNTPEHHTVLPFTRGLAGPIDYTPGIFDIEYKNAKNRVKWNDLDDGSSRVNTTLAKQLALFVVLYSPLQMAADIIDNYEDQPAFQFIEDFGTDWETTKVINGKIGDYITIARKEKNSKHWFLGSITDEHSRTLEIVLDFLDPNTTYRAEIYADGLDADWKTNPSSIQVNTKVVNSKSVLTLKLAKGGGQAIRFVPLL